jgi:uncharacterized DUF497 family protein
VNSGIEFDWDDANTEHLAAHEVSREEFEQVIINDAIELDYEIIDAEERYRSVGVTDVGRLLSIVWTLREEKLRPITAFPAPPADRRAFLRRPR